MMVLHVMAKKSSEKNPAAVAMNAMRNKKLSPARRKEIAKNAANKRWADAGQNGVKADA